MLFVRDCFVSLHQNSHHGTSRFDTERQQREIKNQQILSLLKSITIQDSSLHSSPQYTLSFGRSPRFITVVDITLVTTVSVVFVTLSTLIHCLCLIAYFRVFRLVYPVGLVRIQTGEPDVTRVYGLCRGASRVALAMCGSGVLLLSNSFPLFARADASDVT